MQIPYTNIRIKATRWPWMRRPKPALLEMEAKQGDKYGWLRNSTLGRFGGGHQWVLGVSFCKTDINFNLLFGSISISWYKPKKKDA